MKYVSTTNKMKYINPYSHYQARDYFWTLVCDQDEPLQVSQTKQDINRSRGCKQEVSSIQIEAMIDEQ